ncbi:FAD-dependent oxidoreductase [Microbacterium sp. gxy059]|uniref:FAD-dependent oxidoreductase n=1 Tax=Microbacterium sp. gxy059 TaxID=2957199 RepID=UPI003D986BA2
MTERLEGLAGLESRVRRQIGVLAHPDADWTDGADADADVVVIGGGQAGLTAAAKLRREGVARVQVLDREDRGREGPWATWARMRTLRTPKILHGPDAGVPAATFAAWFSAQHGERAWEELDLIPRPLWAEYLAWVRRVFDLDVRNGVEVLDVVPRGDRVAVRVRERRTGETRTILARSLVVATGIDGVGGPRIPDAVAHVDPARRIHSSGALDADSLRGRRVAVLGAGASAFDNAATALEAGARSVVQYVRRPELPTLNTARSGEFRGMYRHYEALDDRDKLDISRRRLSLPIPPPDHSVARCRAHAAYDLRLGRGWRRVEETPLGVRIEDTAGESAEFDLLILGTGFAVDLDRVPWLSSLSDDIALWADRHPLGDSAVDRTIARYPYLGEGMRLLRRTPAADPAIERIHMFNGAGLVSGGIVTSGINGLAIGSDAVARAVTRTLFLDEARRHTEAFLAETAAGFEAEPAAV